MVSRSAGAGSVVAYNYMDDGYIGGQEAWLEIGLNGSHMVGSHHMLFEGNYASTWTATTPTATPSTTHSSVITRPAIGRGSQTIDGVIVDDIDESSWRQRSAACRWRAWPIPTGFFYWQCPRDPGHTSGWIYHASLANRIPAGIWLLGWDGHPHPQL